MYQYQELKESFVEMEVFNGSTETHTEKNEKTNIHTPSKACETLPLREKENTSIIGKLHQLMGDKTFRTKIFHTFLLYLAFGFQGWIKSQFGPVYLDLQRITGAGQEECSWLSAMCLIGQMVAAPTGGVLHTKTNSFLTMGIAHVGAAVTVCCIPWCSQLSLMMVAYFVLGMFFGAIATIIDTEIFCIWKGKGKILMQGLQLALAFGGVLCPPLTALFLLPPDNLSLGNTTVTDRVFNNTQHIQSTTTIEHIALSTENDFYVNTTDTGSTHSFPANKQSSRLYIIFVITGALGLVVAFGFFALFRMSMTQTYVLDRFDTEQYLEIKNGAHSKFTKYGSILALSVILLLGGGIEYGYNTFLVSFVVKQMNWTKSMGSSLTSLVFLFEVVGMVIGIVLITFVSPESLATFYCSVSVIAFINFLISTLFTTNIGIWIFGSLFGYARSIIFSMVFIWYNDRLFPLTAQMSSVFIIGWTSGSVINPVIMGYIIEHFSDIWFCYVLLGESILLLGICIISLIMTKIIVKRKGTPTVQPNQLMGYTNVNIFLILLKLLGIDKSSKIGQ